MALASNRYWPLAAGVLAAVTFLLPISARCQSVDPAGPADPAKGTIAGLVVNAVTNRVVPRADVVLRNVRKAGDVKSVRADDEGRFIFRGVEPGIYRLAADRQSFLSDMRKRSYQPMIEVSAGAQIKDLVLRLLPTAAISGTIVDEHSDPMQHIQVKLLAREYRRGRLRLNTVGLGITDDRGEYRIYGLRPGGYYILAEYKPALRDKKLEIVSAGNIVGVIERAGIADPTQGAVSEREITYPPLFYPATSDFLQAQALPLGPGDEARADFVFFSTPSVSIKGVVINGVTGERVKNASVTAFWTDYLGGAGGIPGRISSEDGTFEVRGVAPGTYTLRTEFSDATGGNTDQRTVEVGVHGLENVLLAGQPEEEIEGQVTVEGGAKFPAAHVSVDFAPTRLAGDFRALANLPDLDFHGRLHPGEHYMVNALNLPADFYLKSVRLSGHEVERNDLVASGAREKVELALSPAGGHIDGLVTDDKDQPAPAYILLVPDEPKRKYFDLFRTARADVKGKFTLRGLAPGTYRLIAFEGVDPDELINHPELLKEYEGKGETVIVSESGKYYQPVRLIPGE
ncbi:MAG TPA: carboxypeptidase-like regulatory domain-containing protein [Candidatus Angelobacter sp.]